MSWLSQDVMLGRLRGSCRPSESVQKRLGFRFPDWIERGSKVPTAVERDVTGALIEQLERADRAGFRWGVCLGAVLGLLAGAVMAALGVGWTMLR
ncbi:MAG: hypothetical protein JXA67_17935 [Micromonosporaceae bacterium]|nr:hypothetical protein [Micromonosporaceae bacterium]